MGLISLPSKTVLHLVTSWPNLTSIYIYATIKKVYVTMLKSLWLYFVLEPNQVFWISEIISGFACVPPKLFWIVHLAENTVLHFIWFNEYTQNRNINSCINYQEFRNILSQVNWLYVLSWWNKKVNDISMMLAIYHFIRKLKRFLYRNTPSIPGNIVYVK